MPDTAEGQRDTLATSVFGDALMASIIVISGEQEGEFLPLGRRISVIGRAENLPLQLLDDLVSRKHLRIRFDEAKDRYEAEDMDSRHGVFINHNRISQPTSLSDGDEILVGQTTLMFTTEDVTDRESALSHYKKVGERSRQTRLE
jgi:pSer/pThr/pTyr-binding forkhead associated (FHA) protein